MGIDAIAAEVGYVDGATPASASAYAERIAVTGATVEARNAGASTAS